MRLIDADALIAELHNTIFEDGEDRANVYRVIQGRPAIDAVPVIRCRECRWWDKIGDSPIGYCHACKHGHYSNRWEISIRRTYKGDFFCADGERSGGDVDG